MKSKKYVMMGGFAFADNTDMKKLKKLAKKGLMLCPTLHTKLEEDA